MALNRSIAQMVPSFVHNLNDFLASVSNLHRLQNITAFKSCPALCDPMDCSQPGSSVHGILQARVLEWVVIPFSKGSIQPRGWIFNSYDSHIGRRVLYHLHHLGSSLHSIYSLLLYRQVVIFYTGIISYNFVIVPVSSRSCFVIVTNDSSHWQMVHVICEKVVLFLPSQSI